MALVKQSHLLMICTFVMSAAEFPPGCALRTLAAILRDRGKKLTKTKTVLAPIVLTKPQIKSKREAVISLTKSLSKLRGNLPGRQR